MIKRRCIVTILQLLLALVLLVCVILSGFAKLLSTDSGKEYINKLVQNELSKAIGYSIAVEDICFQFPLNINIVKLSLADNQGIWLEATGVKIKILPIPLWHHLILRSVTSDALELYRAPDNPATSVGNNTGIDISVLSFGFKKATIASAITRLQCSVAGSIDGSLMWNAVKEKLTFKVDLDTAEGLSQIRSGTTDIHGQGNLNFASSAINVVLQSAPFKLEKWTQDFTGVASVDVTITGDFDQPLLDARINTSSVSYKERLLPDAIHHITGKHESDSWAGVAQIIIDDDRNASATYQLDETKIQFKNIIAVCMNNQLKGNLTVHTNNLVVEGMLSVTLPNLEKLSGYLSQNINGFADGTVKFSGQGSVQLVDVHFYDILINDVALATASLETTIILNKPEKKLKSLNIKLTDALYKNVHFSKAELRAVSKDMTWITDLNVNGTMQNPFEFRANTTIDISYKNQFGITIPSFSGHYFPHTSFAGKTSGTLVFSGGYAKPIIHGDIRLIDGSYSFLPLGVFLKNIQATVETKDNIFKIENFHAEDRKEGVLAGNGRASLTSDGDLSYKASLNAKKIALINHLYMRGLVSGKITLEGDSKKGNIIGMLSNDSLNIYLPDKFQNNIPELNIVDVAPGKTKVNKMLFKKDSYPLSLDISWQAYHKVFVRGRGVNAELNGVLAAKGPISNLKIEGQLTTMRGSYEEFGKKFKLKQGELRFEGEIPPSPYLKIVGTIMASGVEIMPSLSGPILAPVLSIESHPVMPQEEALSMLFFGKNANQINIMQAAQLSNSLLKLGEFKDLTQHTVICDYRIPQLGF